MIKTKFIAVWNLYVREIDGEEMKFVDLKIVRNWLLD